MAAGDGVRWVETVFTWARAAPVTETPVTARHARARTQLRCAASKSVRPAKCRELGPNLGTSPPEGSQAPPRKRGARSAPIGNDRGPTPAAPAIQELLPVSRFYLAVVLAAILAGAPIAANSTRSASVPTSSRLFRFSTGMFLETCETTWRACCASADASSA